MLIVVVIATLINRRDLRGAFELFTLAVIGLNVSPFIALAAYQVARRPTHCSIGAGLIRCEHHWITCCRYKNRYSILCQLYRDCCWTGRVLGTRRTDGVCLMNWS